jgi:glycosyltransferase involved in cell wall biosynthesis
MPIKVLHLIVDLGAGGAQSALVRLATGLPPQEWAMQVGSLSPCQTPLAERLRAAHLPLHDFSLGRGRGGVNLRRVNLLRLYQTLRRERPHLLHTWLFHANLLGRLVGRLAGVPLILTSRRNVEIGGGLREALNALTGGLDDGVLAVCEAARQAEITRGRRRPQEVTTVYNGVESPALSQAELAGVRFTARRRLELDPGAFMVGSVGRLHPQKGYPILLEAFARFAAQAPEARLLIVGQGEQAAHLQDLARRLGCQAQVTFCGLRHDLEQVYPALDVFVSASLWEGLPNVVLEAMAQRLPVIATRVGGTPEVVQDAVTGLLVEPGQPAPLVAALRRLHAAPHLRLQMGQAGWQRVGEHFSVQAMLDGTASLYRRLLQAKGLL